tara:strand:+ start:122 stop:379 length:258 start_codon:yes stop_codon:yes gene_type:complete
MDASIAYRFSRKVVLSFDESGCICTTTVKGDALSSVFSAVVKQFFSYISIYLFCHTMLLVENALYIFFVKVILLFKSNKKKEKKL